MAEIRAMLIPNTGTCPHWELGDLREAPGVAALCGCGGVADIRGSTTATETQKPMDGVEFDSERC